MTENSLIFLDCEILIENEKIKFKIYRKFGEKTIFLNYQIAVSPKSILFRIFSHSFITFRSPVQTNFIS
jgi:hypothetical protein